LKHHPTYPLPPYVCKWREWNWKWMNKARVEEMNRLKVSDVFMKTKMKRFLIGWMFLFEEAISIFSFFNVWKVVSVTGR
jgi:hypothetical protein